MFNKGKRWGESGNVFFTLFGAVAMVGVVGVATSTLMRGPVGTVMALNQKAKVDAQLQIARKLAGLASDGNSCDAATEAPDLVEPLAPAACAGSVPAGGGCLPATVGAAKQDPWGTNVGYCAWDHGIAHAGCGGLLAGNMSGSNPVIVVVSAGADRTFQTTCAADPAYVATTPGSDDIVWTWTYDEAVDGLGGGLWKLKSAGVVGVDDDISELDLSVNTSFSSGMTAAFKDNSTLQFNPGTTLDLASGALFNLPDQVAMPDAQCTATNTGILRRDTSAGGQVLQICDPTNGGWVDIGGAGASASVYGDTGEIQFNSGDTLYSVPGFTYDVGTSRLSSPNLAVSGTATLGATTLGATSVTSTLGVSGLATLNDVTADDLDAATLDVTGASNLAAATLSGQLTVNNSTDLNGALDVSGTSTLGTLNAQATTVTSLSATQAVDFDLTLNVDGDTTLEDVGADSYELGSIGSGEGMFAGAADEVILRAGGNAAITIQNDGDVGISNTNPQTALDVGGAVRLGNEPVSCTASIYGAIRYASGDKLELCSDTGAWVTIGTDGGGGTSAMTWRFGDNYIHYQNSSFIVDEGQDIQFKSAMKGAGSRFLWYPQKKAFRAGEVTGTQWDDPQVGLNSMALGLDAEASGAGSLAFGQTVTASTANAIALGLDANAAGVNSMALGLGNATGAPPVVSGQNSLGIFMGDRSGMNMNSASTMGIFGGEVIIDPAGAKTTPSGSLTFGVEGQAGATEFCDNAGGNCFRASDIANGTIGAPGNDSEVVFNSSGLLWTDPSFVFTSAGRLGIGTGDPQTMFDVAGTIRIADGGETCDAALLGAIRYLSANDTVEFCADNAGTPAWTAVTSGGTFIDLADTPTTYASAAGLYLRVNPAENAVEFTPLTAHNVPGEPLPPTVPVLIALDELTDVDAPAPGDGHVLYYSAGAGNYIVGALPPGTGDNLGDHTATQNIDMAGFDIVNGDNASFSGNVVVDSTTLAVDAVTHRVGVGTASPQDLLHIAGGNIRVDNDSDTTNKGCIRYNGGTNKIQFSHDCALWSDMGSGGGGGSTTLAGLTDVDVTGAANGQCLIFNSVSGKWEDGSCAAGGGDNLGNHTAVQDLAMAGNDILNAGTVAVGIATAADALHVVGNLRIDNDTNATSKGCIRYNGGVSKLQFSHDCTTYMDMGSGSGGGGGGGTPPTVQAFTANGTWNKPANLSYIEVWVVGGGGGARTAMGNGQAGTSSSFGSFLSATGGAGGSSGGVGAGGSGSGGNLNLTGGSGTSGGGGNGAGPFPGRGNGGGIGGNGGGGGGAAMEIIPAASLGATETVTIGTGGNQGGGGAPAADAGGIVVVYEFYEGGGGGSADNLGNHTATQDLNMANYSVTNTGSVRMTLVPGDPPAGTALGDNLGNHTAATDLAMGGNDILNAGDVTTATASVLGGPLTVDNNTDGTNKGCIRFDGGTNKLQFSHDCSTYADMGSGGGATALSTLTDVDVTGVANGACLVYNNSTSKWEDGTCGAGMQVAFSVHKNGTNQTVTAGAAALLTWPTELYDTNSNFATNRFTPTVAGYYAVMLQVECNGSATTAAFCTGRIHKNGTEVAFNAASGNTGNNARTLTSAVVYLNGSGDYVDAYVVNSDGTSILGTSTRTYFTGALISGGGSGGGATALSTLTDVDVTGVANGACLVYNNSTSKWEDGTCGSGGGGGTPVAFAVARSGNQSIPNITATKVTYATELFDTNNNFASNRFTPTIAGKYILTAGAQFSDAISAATYGGISIYKNGSIFYRHYEYHSGTGNMYIPLAISAVVDANGAGDYFEIFVEHNHGSARNIGAGETNYFTGALISAANGADNLGNHTATQDIDLATNDIINATDITYSGALTDTSDMRLKTDIAPLGTQDMLNRLGMIDTYSFRMKANPGGPLEYGVMAQEIERVFPNLVHTADDEMGTKSVNYIGLIAPLIEANKALSTEVAALKAERAEMSAVLAAVQSDIKGLKAHTGYGIGKAGIGLGMLGGMGMSGAAFLFFRRRRQK